MKIKRSKSDLTFDIINTFLLTVILIIVIYPLIYIVSASISDPAKVTSGEVWLWPIGINFKGYTAVAQYNPVLMGYANSFYYAIVGTAINVFMTLIAAYPLSRKEFYGRNVLIFLITFTMMFSGGLIPTYLLVKSLGMVNTRWSLIIPGAIGVWNLIITRIFLQTSIPGELYDSAEIDGAGDLRTFLQIVIPLARPVIAVITLYYAVDHWNSYFDALIYLNKQNLFPLQIPLRNILILNSMDMSMLADVEEMVKRQQLVELLKYSLIVVASLPVMLLYPFVQKHFVKGLLIGSVKG
ncbi:MAG: carbohydrate ABC transporter permease [Treponema sp.]|nr:carbohydrate ABC transporter permease [Treponema sp.]